MIRKTKSRRGTSVTQIEELHERLRSEHQVTDVKFASGAMDNAETHRLFDAIGVALRSAADGRFTDPKPVEDSYGRKTRRGF